MLARIEHLHLKLNAYITVTAELALAQARKQKPNSSPHAAAKAVGPRPAPWIPISLKAISIRQAFGRPAGSKSCANSFQKKTPHRHTTQTRWRRLLGKTNMRRSLRRHIQHPHYGRPHPGTSRAFPAALSGGPLASLPASASAASERDTGGPFASPPHSAASSG